MVDHLNLKVDPSSVPKYDEYIDPSFFFILIVFLKGN